jgi:membrane protease YdiL (CAAX protease family)
VDNSPATFEAAAETIPTPVDAPDAPTAPVRLPRWAAALQVFLVCGIPTQLVIVGAMVVADLVGLAHIRLFEGTQPTLEFFAISSLLDTAAIALLIRLFLAMTGETSREVFLGDRPVWGEIVRGLWLLPVVFPGVIAVVLLLRTVAPGLHTVEKSPLEAFLGSPVEAAIFLFVAVLAGGVREELQRAFILRRFEQRLGGIRLGLVLFTLTFGLLHVYEGVDVAVAIGLLGLFWGLLYIWRRSAVMAMVNHAGFNAAQVIQAVLARSLGL